MSGGLTPGPQTGVSEWWFNAGASDRSSVFFKAGTPVHCTVFPTCVYRLSPLESKIFAANKLRLWT